MDSPFAPPPSPPPTSATSSPLTLARASASDLHRSLSNVDRRLRRGTEQILGFAQYSLKHLPPLRHALSIPPIRDLGAGECALLGGMIGATIPGLDDLDPGEDIPIDAVIGLLRATGNSLCGGHRLVALWLMDEPGARLRQVDDRVADAARIRAIGRRHNDPGMSQVTGAQLVARDWCSAAATCLGDAVAFGLKAR